MPECSACGLAQLPGTLFCQACAQPIGAAAPVAVASRTIARLVGLENLVPTGRVLSLPPLDWEGELLIGRSDLEAGVVVDLDLGAREKRTSRRHARLRYEAGVIRLEDWASAHGTFLNKQKLAPGVPVMVADGDEIRFAEAVYRLEMR